MNTETRAEIDYLLADASRLLQQKPFTRGSSVDRQADLLAEKDVALNDTVTASLPNIKRNVVLQDDFLQELDPSSHKVLFDDNIPSITMKLADGSFQNIEYKKMAVPYQQLIKDKHVLHLCGNNMQFTLMNTEPTEQQVKDFITFKQYWGLRNMDGMKTKMVDTQKSYGIAGLLFYHDYNGRIKARLLSYEDGYVLCPHNDDNGDRILESVYYRVGDDEYIDSYDEKYMYRHILNSEEREKGFQLVYQAEHGFSEIPLITKRGEVAWNRVQNIIEVYEVIYNVFLVIQKRHGWGILYVKGKISEKAKKIAGAIVLNDLNPDSNGSAEFKAPPSPQNMIDTLSLMEETIQKGSGATFILPKDINSSGDISAQAIMLTQSLDIETALQGVIDWQNVADKMTRLFKEGLAKELEHKSIDESASSRFEDVKINAKFKVWRPQNDTDYNSMLIQLKGSNVISNQTATEKCTESSPDEKVRLAKERELGLQEQEQVIKDVDSPNKVDIVSKNEQIIREKESGI